MQGGGSLAAVVWLGAGDTCQKIGSSTVSVNSSPQGWIYFR
jgi:hypothetical protein